MDRHKFHWIGLLVTFVLITSAFNEPYVEASCYYCGVGGEIWGYVTEQGGGPAPNGTVVYAVCDVHPNECDGYSDQCQVTGGNGEYHIYPDCPSQQRGHLRMWAEYINNDCKYYSDEVEVNYHNGGTIRQDFVLTNIYCW